MPFPQDRPILCNFWRPGGVLEPNDEPPVNPSTPGTNPSADFITFMRQYQDMVYTTAARILADDAQAEDVAQEVFVKAHDHFEMLSSSPSAGGWLKTVTTRQCLNHLQRYRKRWRFFSEMEREDDSGPPETFEIPDSTPAPDWDAQTRRKAIDESIAALPANHRVPLVLFHFEELSYEEIAERLGVSLAKVKTDIFRARAALARSLGQQGWGGAS